MAILNNNSHQRETIHHDLIPFRKISRALSEKSQQLLVRMPTSNIHILHFFACKTQTLHAGISVLIPKRDISYFLQDISHFTFFISKNTQTEWSS